MSSAETIFLHARELVDAAEQRAYLDRACGGDSALRGEVESMLAAAPGAAAFFDQAELHHPTTARVGEVVGRYKLLEKIGEGGMGTVYMAEQTEPVRRKVALKLIKLGMDTRQVVARFEAESQALALMDHPNVAKVLDGGATEAGRPYFVMDLVQGPPITEFCDEAQLSTGQRLDLFLEVCSAIEHAHQKGIIHRDIKPSNILVTLDGDKPVPKVIDFGIAKAIRQRLTDKTLITQFQQFVGTPAYTSPEQVGLSGLDIDTRSDIYALGVLLYELLTGSTPFDGRELIQAGLDAMRRTILEREPARPSAKLSTFEGDRLAQAARQRRAEPLELVHRIRGDLDWIVMKCLEKDRARRYTTVTGLAADLRRHMTHEPVLARPPSAVYRFHKIVQRHRVVSSAVVAVALAIVIGGISTLSALREARAERRRAERQLREALAFVSQVFKEVAPSLAGIVGASGPHEKLARAGLEFVETLRTQGNDTAELRLVLANVLLRLSSATGSAPNLRSDYSESLSRATAVIALLENLDAGSRETERLGYIHGARVAAGSALFRLCRFEELLENRRAMESVERSMRVFPQFEDVLRQSELNRPQSLGHITTLAGRPRDAIERHLLPRVSGPWAKAITEESPVNELIALANAHAALSFAYLQAGDGAAVAGPAREAIRLRRIIATKKPTDPGHFTHLAEDHGLLGCSLYGSDQNDEAAAAFREGWAILDRLRARDPDNDYFIESVTYLRSMEARGWAALASAEHVDPAERRIRLAQAEKHLAEAETLSQRFSGTNLEQVICSFARRDVEKARAIVDSNSPARPGE